MYSPYIFALLVLSLVHSVSGLKFEVLAHHQNRIAPRCIRHFVSADTLVVVTAIVSGQKGDGQRVNIDVLPLGHQMTVDPRYGGK
jgi:p24 family protein delta-1